MRLLAMNCGHCGAPLEVPPKTRFVTRIYCSSQLEIHRSGDAAYTEVLGAIQAHTEPMARDLEVLKLQQELTELDRQWMAEREEYMIEGENGVLVLPSRASVGGYLQLGLVVCSSFVLGIAGGVAGLGISVFFGIGGGIVGLVIPLFFFVVVFAHIKSQNKWADEYERAHQEYQKRRTALCRAIQSAKEENTADDAGP